MLEFAASSEQYLWKHNQDFFKLPVSFLTFSSNIIIISLASHSFFHLASYLKTMWMYIKQNQIDIVEFNICEFK